MAVILVTGGFDQKIRYWDATSGVCTKTLRFGESQVNKLQISRDKLLIAAGGNSMIHLYDTNAIHDNALQSLDGHTQNVTDLSFLEDGKWLFSCSEDGCLKVWDIRTGSCEISIDTRCSLNSGALNPNGTEIITGDQNGCLKVWDMRTKSLRFDHTPLPEIPIRSLSMSCTGNLLAVGSHKGKVLLYKPSNSKGKEWSLDYQYQAHDTYLLKCLISPDTNTIATTSADHSIKLWKYTPQSPLTPLNYLPPSPSSSSDSLSTANSVSPISLTRCLTSHQRWVWDAVYSADSCYMVSASSDLSAKLWDLRTGDIIRNYLGHSLSVCCVALNDSNL